MSAMKLACYVCVLAVCSQAHWLPSLRLKRCRPPPPKPASPFMHTCL
jgi:hypothetical protein